MAIGNPSPEQAVHRDSYTWDSVVRDIALATPLPFGFAARFIMLNRGPTKPKIHPYDLVEWVAAFYRQDKTIERGVGDPDALVLLIERVFEAGVAAGKGAGE